MRIMEKKEELDYENIKRFFDKRAEKYSKDNPYSVTMYQDDHPWLAMERNRKEIEKLKPLLTWDSKTRVLDVACGIGRWADAIQEEIEQYCGVDFNAELIHIAKERNKKKNFYFYNGGVTEIKKLLREEGKKRYNVLLLIGILLYINDRDLAGVLEELESLCEETAEVCIREPIGLRGRLTLKDFYSEELKDHYHAIYRSRQELLPFLKKTFLAKGFYLEQEGVLFEEGDSLNNRTETQQYFFILKRRAERCIRKQ